MGESALPVISSASKPAQRSRAADQPPIWESVTVPVSGDLVTKARRPDMVTSVPVSGPLTSASMLSGEVASTSGPLSSRYLTPKPARADVLARVVLVDSFVGHAAVGQIDPSHPIRKAAKSHDRSLQNRSG